MVNFPFPIPPKSRETTCTECDQPCRINRTEDLCDECNFHRSHPEMAPGYWTWQKLADNSWGVQATWREPSQLPQPGDSITVHRKNGTTSNTTIRELTHTHYNKSGNLVVHCRIQDAA